MSASMLNQPQPRMTSTPRYTNTRNDLVQKFYAEHFGVKYFTTNELSRSLFCSENSCSDNKVQACTPCFPVSVVRVWYCFVVYVALFASVDMVGSMV